MDWEEAEKCKMVSVLGREYISLELTDEEADPSYMRKTRIPFQWESSLLSRRKEALDDAYRASLAPRARHQLNVVIDHSNKTSTSYPPKSSPSWVKKKRFRKN